MSEEIKDPPAPTPEKAPEVLLPSEKDLILSPSPHVSDRSSVRKIMFMVILCLLPAVAASCIFFGWEAARVIFVCVAGCVFFEYISCRIRKEKNTAGDLSAALTGLLLALNVSPLTPSYLCIIGAFIAIVIAKVIFGGLGQNPFNPAAVARVALLIGAAGPMTRWLDPLVTFLPKDVPVMDAVSSATPLAGAAIAAKMSGVSGITSASQVLGETAGNTVAASALEYYDSWQFLAKAFIGQIPGSLGETSALAILIGGIALIALRVIKYHIPLAILGTVIVFVAVVNHFSPGTTPGPLFHLFTGGLMLGAFFMATDMVTSPVTVKGGILFGIGIGVIVSVIRIYGSFPEGMSFAIVIMNALVPLIDRICYVKPFGHQENIRSRKLEPRRGEIK